CVVMQAVSAAIDDGDIRWAVSVRIRLYLDLYRRERQELVEEFLDRMRSARGHVINFAGLSVYQCLMIGADDITYISEIARRCQIADLEYRLARASLDLGNLACERRQHKPGGLTRPEVIEWTHAHHRQSIADIVLISHDILCHLADAIG